MISNTLFEEVYKIKGWFKNHNTDLIIECECPLNLYLVADECLRWALKNGYSFEIRPYEVEVYNSTNDYKIFLESDESYNIQLIFEACELILKEIKKWLK